MPQHLVIVESPAKAKTIKRFLGKDYSVQASMGHVRDLPESALGVDTKETFEAEYEVPKDKKAIIKKLQDELKASDDLWIATDEDREGEAIGWHLIKALKVGDESTVRRIVFHEITREAIEEAVRNPRKIDEMLVEAQQARRILDRLVGYTLSPFLWSKVYSGLSAGRVQSVAVKIIVDREREIQAFKAEEYWTVDADLETMAGEGFRAGLAKKDGKKFVPADKDEAMEVKDECRSADFKVKEVDEKEIRKTPPPPFTTSTLQQEAGRKLGFSVKQTMMVAQQLYEGVSLGRGEGNVGLITYMRTDSVSLSNKALEDAKNVIEKQYGREYILSVPRRYKTKSKGAQEAHEAIRPTEMERTPESLGDVLDHQQLKLYTLIWNRTTAAQMAAAQIRRIGADIDVLNYQFRATGQTILFDGYLRVYMEGRDESDDNGDLGGEKILPELKCGDPLKCNDIIPEQHFTKPPPRYTEASLVKKLEEEGIGRPSTYAPTISTIQQRGYISKDGRQLVPGEIAFTVTDLLAEHFADIVDLKFTANMEQSLDDIAEGKKKRLDFIKGFYVPFEKLVMSKKQEVSRGDILKEKTLGKDPKTGLEVIARTGRFGPYVQLGRAEDYGKGEKPRSASIPKALSRDTITLDQALNQLSFPKDLGTKDGEPVIVYLGRYGPYVRWGKATGTVPKEMDPGGLTLESALGIIASVKDKRKKMSEPLKVLGEDPNTKAVIEVREGRYGPYVTDGKTNASIPKSFDPYKVTLMDAAEWIEKKRHSPKRKWGRKRGL